MVLMILLALPTPRTGTDFTLPLPVPKQSGIFVYFLYYLYIYYLTVCYFSFNFVRMIPSKCWFWKLSEMTNLDKLNDKSMLWLGCLFAIFFQLEAVTCRLMFCSYNAMVLNLGSPNERRGGGSTLVLVRPSNPEPVYDKIPSFCYKMPYFVTLLKSTFQVSHAVFKTKF